MTEQTNNSEPQTDAVRQKIVAALKTCYDPEIPVDIYELGLIYGIDIDTESKVKITMTLTSPNCPVAESLPSEVRSKISQTEGVKDCQLELVFEPPWSPEKMSEAAKLKLNMM